MKKAIVLYMPVIHQGYLSLIQRHQPADVVLISAKSAKLIDAVIADQLSRDIRAIETEKVFHFLDVMLDTKIWILKDLSFLERYDHVIMPDEDISHSLKKKLVIVNIEFDNQFLRWDWKSTNTSKEVVSDSTVSTDELDRMFMGIAEMEAQKSSDFWRQVGAVVPLGPDFLTAFNEHLPTPMEPYVNGDMRLIMNPGEKPEICGAIHAEKALFAQALKLGISLNGKDMYVATFPCLSCAQMISRVGIKRLFFRVPYSNQNALEVLRSAGIKIIQVQ